MEFSTLYNVLNYAGKQFSSLSVPMRIHHFEKEMKDRTTKWVEASRSASQFLHAPAVLDDPDAYGIDGMKKSDSKTLLAELVKKGITAESSCPSKAISLESQVLAEHDQLMSFQVQ